MVNVRDNKDWEDFFDLMMSLLKKRIFVEIGRGRDNNEGKRMIWLGNNGGYRE